MSEIIVTEEPKKEWRPIIAFEMNKDGMTRTQLLTGSEPLLALAHRKIGMAIDEYLAKQELKQIEEANRIVQAVVPKSVLDKIRG